VLLLSACRRRFGPYCVRLRFISAAASPLSAETLRILRISCQERVQGLFVLGVDKDFVIFLSAWLCSRPL
jgi:hypothetical protein